MGGTLDEVAEGDRVVLRLTARHAGARYTFRRKMPGQIIEGQFQLTEYDPGKAIMMQCDWVGPLRPTGGYRLEPILGGTRVHMVERVQFRGLLRWLEPLMALMVRRSANTLLANLKRILEDQH